MKEVPTLPGKTWLWVLGKKLLTPYFFNRFSLEGEGKLPSPPFLLIANHLSALDPFFIDALSPYPIVWVANRLIFEHPLLGPLIRAMDAIPKRKGIPDCSTVLRMLRVLEDGGVVGLFPEGSIPWNGVNEGLALKAEKLLLKLQVPVVFAHIRGAWMRKPLWADHPRTGSVSIRFSVLSDAASLPLAHSEWEWQKREWIVFQDERSAEGIERVVFFCPHCGSFRSIIGRGRDVLCRSCGHRWTVDAYGFIGGKTQEEFCENQEELLADYVSRVGRIVLPRALVSERLHPRGTLRRFFASPIHVEREGLRLQDEFLPFSRIRGENTFLKKVFECTVGKSLFRIRTGKDAFLLLNLVRMGKARLSSAE